MIMTREQFHQNQSLARWARFVVAALVGIFACIASCILFLPGDFFANQLFQIDPVFMAKIWFPCFFALGFAAFMLIG